MTQTRRQFLGIALGSAVAVVSHGLISRAPPKLPTLPDDRFALMAAKMDSYYTAAAKEQIELAMKNISDDLARELFTPDDWRNLWYPNNPWLKLG